MWVKKLGIAFGAISSITLLMAFCGWGASFLYERFLFQGEMSDFAPGDAIGELLVFLVLTLPLLCVNVMLWHRAYRRISS
jgi:hypothetical protein